jgi:hypothetical protein
LRQRRNEGLRILIEARSGRKVRKAFKKKGTYKILLLCSLNKGSGDSCRKSQEVARIATCLFEEEKIKTYMKGHCRGNKSCTEEFTLKEAGS